MNTVKRKSYPSKEYLHTIFRYEDGNLFWKKKPNYVISADSVAGRINEKGYIRLGLNGEFWYAHRLVYMMFHGYVPTYIDHINGNKADNRIENLRECTNSENKKNSGKYVTNTSGVKGVYWRKDINKWNVSIRFEGKNKSLGFYKDFKEATKIAEDARRKHYGEFYKEMI